MKRQECQVSETLERERKRACEKRVGEARSFSAAGTSAAMRVFLSLLALMEKSGHLRIVHGIVGAGGTLLGTEVLAQDVEDVQGHHRVGNAEGEEDDRKPGDDAED